MGKDYEVAVIGLGAMGSAALSALAARKIGAIGIEARTPAHRLSSSHGDSRLIRLGYFEGPGYVPLLRRAYANWRTLERRAKTSILSITGVLQIGPPDSPIVRGTLESCRVHGLAHEALDAAQMRERYPMYALNADEVAVLDPEGGYLRPEVAINAYLDLAREDGAEISLNDPVLSLERVPDGIEVVTRAERYRVGKVIVATGAWISELVPQLRPLASPIRQVVAWYKAADEALVAPERMPAFIIDEPAGSFFGFPAIGADGIKVGRHEHFREPVDPNEDNLPVNAQDRAMLDEFIARRIPTAAGLRVAETTCRYTMLPSEDFLIDLLPDDRRIVVCSACSGHGFKFASVIGELLADLALEGGSGIPHDGFAFARHLARC